MEEEKDNFEKLVEYLEFEYWHWGTHNPVECANLERYDDPKDKLYAHEKEFMYLHGNINGIGFCLQKAYHYQGRDIEVGFTSSAGWTEEYKEKREELIEEIEEDE